MPLATQELCPVYDVSNMDSFSCCPQCGPFVLHKVSFYKQEYTFPQMEWQHLQGLTCCSTTLVDSYANETKPFLDSDLLLSDLAGNGFLM